MKMLHVLSLAYLDNPIGNPSENISHYFVTFIYPNPSFNKDFA